MDEELKQTALKLLEEVDVKVVDTIEIDNSNYDDGTSALTIRITYPAKGGEN